MTEGFVATVSSRRRTSKQLLALLDGGQAHAGLRRRSTDFPAELRGTVPEGLPYSAWQLLEHLRIAQRDILNFSAPPTGGYHPLQWPEDYWPKVGGAADRRVLGSGAGGDPKRSGEV